MNDNLIIDAIDQRDHKPLMEREELRDAISLSLWAGQMLLQNGADTKRVEEIIHHIGTGLGCDWLDIVVQLDAVIATTTNNHEFRTKVRRVPNHGVNMQVIAEIADLSYQLTNGELDRFQLRRELRRVDKMPRNYNRWVVVFGVGLACAAFSRLFAGDWSMFFVTFSAASMAMFIRQELHRRYINPLVTVALTALVAGLVVNSAALFDLSTEPSIALAASALLLVPGVPLINAAEDLIQGYILTGVIRGITGVLIALAIALGLVFAIWITGVPSV
ncbi:MAG: threonine/serine exporter family protein [Anaerolineae bacterium]|nr:threonine/serine exporter family protein [Anaerolineae bacterium]